MRLAPLVPIAGFALVMSAPAAAQSGSSGEVTFTRDIAPILQRSCQQCHNASGVAPMPLTTYEEVRPWSRAIKTRTALGPRAGVMPPWFVERNIGIQHFKNDPSLSEAEIALIAKWVDAGAPRGNAADMPPPRDFANADKWTIGEPDLVLRSPDIVVPAVGPDKWGSLGTVPTGLKEDRYVSGAGTSGTT
jgi:mono/diheme cytochrome c family protein